MKVRRLEPEKIATWIVISLGGCLVVALVVFAAFALIGESDESDERNEDKERIVRLQRRVDEQAGQIDEALDLLNRRTPIIEYIRATEARDQCVDAFRDNYLVTLGAALEKSDDLERLQAFFAARDALGAAESTCPPVPVPE